MICRFENQDSNLARLSVRRAHWSVCGDFLSVSRDLVGVHRAHFSVYRTLLGEYRAFWVYVGGNNSLRCELRAESGILIYVCIYSNTCIYVYLYPSEMYTRAVD